jgi:hypothetical protein
VGGRQDDDDLPRAFDDILAPHSNYCSNEQELRADGGKLAREFAARAGM